MRSLRGRDRNERRMAEHERRQLQPAFNEVSFGPHVACNVGDLCEKVRQRCSMRPRVRVGQWLSSELIAAIACATATGLLWMAGVSSN